MARGRSMTRGTSRRRGRTRSYTRRRMGIGRVPRNLRGGASVRTGFLSLRQKAVSNQVIPAGAYPNGFLREYTFKAADIPQFQQFAGLFDQYRIMAVKMTFLPTSNTNDTVNQGGTFASSIDLDGDLSIVTFNQLLQCANTKTSPWSCAGGMTPYKAVYLKPRANNALITEVNAQGQPASFSTQLADPMRWIDIADRGNTIHYGVNIGWNFGNNQLNAPVDVQMITTYYIQFRKVR